MKRNETRHTQITAMDPHAGGSGSNSIGEERILLTRISLIVTMIVSLGCNLTAHGQIMLSANENKFDLTQGGQKPIPNAAPDSLTLIDFSKTPPATFTIDNVPNTVIGPPSNVGISPDGKMALVANSVKIENGKDFPESYVHIVDLSSHPPKVVGRVTTNLQPS